MEKELISNRFRWGNVVCAPIVHSRYYFALWVQRLADEYKPEIIAVEFPVALRELIIQGARRLPCLSVVTASPDGENYSYIPIDPCDALIHAVRLGIERGIPVHFVDLNRFDLSNRIMHYTPDDWTLPRIGAEAFYEKTMESISLSEPGSVDYMREQHMAARLRNVNCLERRTLFVCGMIHWERVRGFLESGGGFEYFDLEEPEANSFLANLHPGSAKEVLEEIPAVAGEFETARRAGEMDRNAETGKLIARAEAALESQISIGAKKTLMKYLRNLAFTSLQFTPDLVDLLTAAKNVCGDEFAFKLMEIAEKYPYEDASGDLPTIHIKRTFEESDEGRLGMKTIRLRRREEVV